jgi:hypothetical protein
MRNFLIFTSQNQLRYTSGYPVTSGVSLWTSGIQDKFKKTSWCSKKVPATNEPLNWAGGQPPAVDGCLTLTLSNSSANLSTFELSNCNVEHYFVCEVCRESEAYFHVMAPQICRKPWQILRLTSCRKTVRICMTSRQVGTCIGCSLT